MKDILNQYIMAYPLELYWNRKENRGDFGVTIMNTNQI